MYHPLQTEIHYLVCYVFFADNAKLVTFIRKKQLDFVNLQIWYYLTYLFLNILIRIYIALNPINYQYYISDSKIEFVSKFKDVKIIFDGISN